MTEEMISDKIDRLNSVIGQLMNELDDNLDNKLKPPLASVQNSFYENSYVKSDCFDSGIDEFFIPQEFIDRFQEALTQTDRLGMILEDLQTKQKNDEEKLFEIFISTDQIIALNERILKVLETSNDKSLFRLTRSSLEFIDIKLVNSDVFSKLKETELENLKLKNELKLKNNSLKARTSEISEKDLGTKLIQVEKKILELRYKEQELDRMKEECGYLLAKAEILINKYEAKSRKLDKKVHQRNDKKSCKSQDITRTRTSVSIAYPLSTNFLIPSFFQYKQQIEEKLSQFEIIIKEKYRKKNRNQSKIPAIFEEFQKKDLIFWKRFQEKSDLEQREKFLNEFLKDSRDFLKKKVEELEHYQNFLMENWIKANGEPAGIDVIKRYSSNYFHKLLSFNDDRENIEDMYLRNKIIEENIKNLVKQLQEHRRKIMNERQFMQGQQKQIEKYLMIIAKLNSISII
jgi:hypothetical protein